VSAGNGHLRSCQLAEHPEPTGASRICFSVRLQTSSDNRTRLVRDTFPLVCTAMPRSSSSLSSLVRGFLGRSARACSTSLAAGHEPASGNEEGSRIVWKVWVASGSSRMMGGAP
jgi:hypothetical protein